MRKLQIRQAVAVIAAACLLPVNGWGQAATAPLTGKAVKIRQKAEQLGIGADVRVRLRTDERLQGRIDSAGEASFVIEQRQARGKRPIRYEDVTLLEFATKEFRADKRPDAADARRVAVELGEGATVTLKTKDGRTLKGRLDKVDPEQLMITMGDRGSANVAYSEVQLLKGRMSGRAKAITIAGAAGGGLAAFSVILTLLFRED